VLNINLSAEVNSEKLTLFWAKLKLITIALLMSSVIYGIIIYFLEQSISSPVSAFEPQSESFRHIIRNVMVALTLMTIAAIIVAAKALVNKVVKGSTKIPFAIDSPLAPHLAAYFNYKVITLAISDSIGLYGLVIYFLSKDLHLAFILIALSCVMKIIQFPTPNRFIALMEKYKQLL
jgi:hypothetical protein